MIFPEQGQPEGIHVHQDHSVLTVDTGQIRTLIDCVLQGEKRQAAFLSVLLTQKSTVLALNQKWRKDNYETDVLSFPLGNSSRIEGEIYISMDFAYEHCSQFGATFTQEVCRYVVHGLLHLLGYSDTSPEEASTMRRLEDLYLQASGIIVAYADAPQRTAPNLNAA